MGSLAGLSLVGVLGTLGAFSVMGPPQVVSAAVNQARHVPLALDSVVRVVAPVLLHETLVATGKRVRSTLATAAVLVAGPLYVGFDAVPLLLYRVQERASVGGPPPPASPCWTTGP